LYQCSNKAAEKRNVLLSRCSTTAQPSLLFARPPHRYFCFNLPAPTNPHSELFFTTEGYSSKVFRTSP
jgi:hypothetical protein